MKRLIAKSSVLIILLALSIFTALSVHAASSGRIAGQLLDGSNNKAPVAGQSVTLQVTQGQNAQDQATTTTDAHGSFSFDNLDSDKTKSYAVYTRYQEAQYVSNLITLDSNPAQQVTITVYQATQSSAKVAVTSMTALLREPNIQKSFVTISEVYVFKNLDTHTYVGSLDASKGKPNALLFSLPDGARNISLGSGFAGYHQIQVDRGFATDAALLPGDNEFSFSFEVPYTSSSYDLRYTPMYPTVSLSFLVPPDIHASSRTLHAQGEVNTGSDQHPYSLFKATGLSTGREIQVGLEGLPASTSAPAPAAPNSSTTLLIVVLLLMAAIQVATWILYRNRRRQPTRKSAARRVKDQVSKGAGSARAVSAAKPASDRQQALLQELLELDKAFEAGKINKASYEERRGKTKARLRALISEQESTRT